MAKGSILRCVGQAPGIGPGKEFINFSEIPREISMRKVLDLEENRCAVCGSTEVTKVDSINLDNPEFYSPPSHKICLSWGWSTEEKK